MAKGSYSRAKRNLKKLTDNELQRLRRDIEFECSQRNLPNSIDMAVEKLPTEHVKVLIDNCIYQMEHRGQAMDVMPPKARGIVVEKVAAELLPFFNSILYLNIAAAAIIQTMIAGRGDTSRQQIHLLDNELAARIADVEKVLKKTNNELNTHFELKNDNLSLPELHRACVAFVDGDDKDGSQFLTMISENEHYHPYIQVRYDNSPGKTPNAIKAQYDRDIYQLVREDGLTIEQSINKLAEDRLYHNIIDNWTDPVEATKKRLQRYEEKLPTTGHINLSPQND
jgi:hypothetical protein